jgi:3-isopropylmalate/(R)-2-methylmalate dehydratase small subunit
MTALRPFIIETGLVAALPRANVDTDAIIPKPFLKSIERSGFGANLFDDWRYLDPYDEQSTRPRRVNQDFVLNRHPYSYASILLASENFGCGSSREHAVWALRDFGFRAVIAPSFGDIFFSNAVKNGLLPVTLTATHVHELMDACADKEYFAMTIDLPRKLVISPAGRHYPFEIAHAQWTQLLNGADEIGMTLESRSDIKEFESRHLAKSPWL